ncbi:hypothetical protein [Paracoccus beibuensis]|uniref:hypothetical protein n=1 Tax=Paracoccus beibuensis TaxID=547602 RepID=UPI002240B4B8|nr:hypothetical protein [Paracoccus beibuensis]
MPASGEIQGFSWENRRRQVALTLAFCRWIYGAALLLTAAAFVGLCDPDQAAWDGVAATLTANTAVYVPTLMSYLFGAAVENRAIASASKGTLT